MLGEVHVQLEALAHLTADRQHGVQRRHRLLEDVGDVHSANALQVTEAQLQEILSVEQDLAADNAGRGGGDEPGDRQDADRLPASAFADQGDRLAGLHVVRDPVDRANR